MGALDQVNKMNCSCDREFTGFLMNKLPEEEFIYYCSRMFLIRRKLHVVAHLQIFTSCENTDSVGIFCLFSPR